MIHLKKTISELTKVYHSELYDKVIPFWETHSIDSKYGGFFNNLDQDGNVYDTSKHVWLQARQVWMFSKLYRSQPDKKNWLNIAKSGIAFLRTNALRDDGRVYFCLNQLGEPVKIQRKIFSECFYIMALSEFAKASSDTLLLEEAKNHFLKVWEWSQNLEKIGVMPHKGVRESQTLAIPMILLNLIEELASESTDDYTDQIKLCIDKMKLHVDTNKKLVFENVGNDGEFIDSPEGRLLNPGHAIEAGWFLQHWALKLNDTSLSSLATNMIRWSFEKGWDNEHGGIFYFLDSHGYSPTQLEWSMKLWWPHCEALYAHLLNFYVTGDQADFESFMKVHDYSFNRFSDRVNGEWFGYLDRTGEVTHRFKGGPYKGCFHVPRSLFLCLNLFKKIDKKL